MNQKSAQLAFVGMTLLFLAAAMVLFLTNTAIVAGAVLMVFAIMGFIVFMAMLVNDARAVDDNPPTGSL